MITRALLRAIVAGYRLDLGGVHGLDHWARVLENGRRLAKATGADLRVVELFAIFHDACRTGEGVDHGHGRRAARLADRLRWRHFELEDRAFELLAQACEEHTAGHCDGDVTVRTCWDADRLDLLRCRIEPRAELLCTEAARDPGLLAWANERARRRAAPALLEAEWRPLLAADDDGGGRS